jgi:signal recognition particle subunit SRP72
MASSTPTLTSLLRQTTLDDHEEVLKAANATLKKSKNNLEALHVKTVALLKLDRYDDALRVLEEGGDALKSRAQLESAYALYKLGRFEDGAKITKDATGGRGVQHIEAQVVRRLLNCLSSCEL